MGKPPRAAGAGGVEQEVVLDQEAGARPARMEVVPAVHAEAFPHVMHDVVCERYLLDGLPGRRAVLITDREQDGRARLHIRPSVLETVAVDENPAAVREREEGVHAPGDAGIARIVHAPGQRLEEMVTADL